jgi:hypothetical protein
MQTSREKKDMSGGFIKIILLVIIGFVILGYFGINVKDIFASPVVKENLSYALDLAKELWTNWLHKPIMWVWDHILAFLWELFWNGLEGLRNNDGPQTLIEQ